MNPRLPAIPRLLRLSGMRRLAFPLLLALLALQGCGHFRPRDHREYIYVWQKEMYLRDRVSPVNDEVARVENGERLLVLQHDGRFMQVKTPGGKIGWLADETVIDQQIYDGFAQMARDNAHAPVLSHGILLYGYWMRDAPGRHSNRFYWLHKGEKLELLRRAAVPRDETPVLPPRTGTAGKAATPPAPELENFWLARDGAGHVGWVRGGALDEDVPQDVEELSIGEKVLEAKVLRTVVDPESDRPNHEVPEYVVALAPWRGVLPYDFDQIRVFTWNVYRHRWETAYRDRDLEGFLPITVSQQAFKGKTYPVFSFRVATDDSARIDPRTGYAGAATSATEVYRLEDTVVRKVSGPDVQAEQKDRKKIEPAGNGRHGRGR